MMAVGILLSLVDPAQGQTTPTTLAQSLSGVELDDSLADLKATFTQIEAVSVPDFATSSPGYTIAVPSAYGSGFGTVYVTAGSVASQRFQDDGQAGVGFGFGLGNPLTTAGLDVNYAITDIDEGTTSLSLKLHRTLADTEQATAAIALGWEDLASTGTPSRDSSVYGVITAIFKLRPDITLNFSRLAFTVGVGGGRFRSEDAVLEGEDTIGIFASSAIRVSQSFSVITEWTGQDLAAGVSWAPVPDMGFYITPGVRDLAGAGDDPRFSISTGLTVQF